MSASRGGEMVYARALRALECITHAGSIPVLGTYKNKEQNVFTHGDEFDGRMSALGAEGTGFNSRVPDQIDLGFEPMHNRCVPVLEIYCGIS